MAKNINRTWMKSHSRSAKGISLIELVTTMIIAVIPLSSVAVLIVGGQHSWGKTYNSANRKIKIDAENACTLFGSMARRSDSEYTALIDSRTGRRSISDNSAPNPNASLGQGIEFRYWAAASEKKTTKRVTGRLWSNRRNQSAAITSVSIVPTEYARFYLNRDNALAVDYGPYPYDSWRRSVSRTIVLAENVESLELQRSFQTNAGQPCVKMVLTMKDPDDGTIITMKTASLLRN